MNSILLAVRLISWLGVLVSVVSRPLTCSSLECDSSAMNQYITTIHRQLLYATVYKSGLYQSLNKLLYKQSQLLSATIPGETTMDEASTTTPPVLAQSITSTIKIAFLNAGIYRQYPEKRLFYMRLIRAAINERLHFFQILDIVEVVIT